jgi:foldase protein PrsA
VDAEFDNLVASSGGLSVVEADLKEMYDWTPEQFKEKVLRPFLLQSKLDGVLRLDEELNASVRAEAEAVLARAQAGEDFAELARAFSTDPSTAPAGGALGWFGKGVMVPEFETAAFALEPEVVSGIVQSPFGYHIILVTDRKLEGGEVTEVSASHILFGFATSEEYLRQQYEAATIERYLKEAAPAQE